MHIMVIYIDVLGNKNESEKVRGLRIEEGT